MRNCHIDTGVNGENFSTVEARRQQFALHQRILITLKNFQIFWRKRGGILIPPFSFIFAYLARRERKFLSNSLARAFREGLSYPNPRDKLITRSLKSFARGPRANM